MPGGTDVRPDVLAGARGARGAGPILLPFGWCLLSLAVSCFCLNAFSSVFLGFAFVGCLLLPFGCFWLLNAAFCLNAFASDSLLLLLVHCYCFLFTAFTSVSLILVSFHSFLLRFTAFAFISLLSLPVDCFRFRFTDMASGSLLSLIPFHCFCLFRFFAFTVVSLFLLLFGWFWPPVAVLLLSFHCFCFRFTAFAFVSLLLLAFGLC
jgi:hypothetical protein